MRRALGMVAGSVVVAVACAAARSSDGPVGGAIDAALDAIGLGDSTAVTDARAEDGGAVGWGQVVATCKTDSPLPSARASVAGRADADLIRSTAMLCADDGWCYQAPLYVRSGEMRATCEKAGSTVTFLIPPTL